MALNRDKPVVFLGLSVDRDRARSILPNADFRAPVRRGDIDSLPDESAILVIDGVFAQSLSVSPREIHNALLRKCFVAGASSMGALRAAEVRGVIGVGRIYEMFASGQIERDDEVAITFDETTHRLTSEPLVNIRYASDELARTGTIPGYLAEEIVQRATGLHFSERNYETILRLCGVADAEERKQLVAMLSAHDLKRDDALSLLEQAAALMDGWQPPELEGTAYRGNEYDDHHASSKLTPVVDCDAPVMIWEYGDRVAFEDVLGLTRILGDFPQLARSAVARYALAGNELSVPDGGEKPSMRAGLTEINLNWGWVSREETVVTLKDLGVGARALGVHLKEEARAAERVRTLAADASREFRLALRSELLFRGLDLKRYCLQVASLDYFASEGDVSSEELSWSRAQVASHLGCFLWSTATTKLQSWGMREHECERWLDRIARARRRVEPILKSCTAAPIELDALLASSNRGELRIGSLALESSPKLEGSFRYCVPFDEAERVTAEIAERIGVTRISMVGELDVLDVQISQAFRPHSRWSGSAGSGKGLDREGARVGAVMEEAEKYAQEQYRYTCQRATYQELRDSHRNVADPGTFDLPFDTRYTPSLALDWVELPDLITEEAWWVPAALVAVDRLDNDICYSARRGKKVFSTNGLASGFSRTEALVHAICEFIERDAIRIAEIQLENPGRCGRPRYAFVDEMQLEGENDELRRRFEAAGFQLRILDIRSEVGVPTFDARLFIPNDPLPTICVGTGTHPNADAALRMALLEAAQTKVGATAGSREDFTIQARSLGRHERPRTALPGALQYWYGPVAETLPLSSIPSACHKDALTDIHELVARVKTAGFAHIFVADYSCEEIAPANAVRVLIPGMESLSPFYTGPRARALSLYTVMRGNR